MAATHSSGIKIGFHLGPQHGDFPTMRRQWLAAEELGVDALYSTDHFFVQDADIEIAPGKRPPATAGMNFEGMTRGLSRLAVSIWPLFVDDRRLEALSQ